MKKLSLVTGANGHLGNTLVRMLAAKGERVRAGVRDTRNLMPFHGVDCEVVHADLLDKQSLNQALAGVDTLYQVAAVFKIWSRNPERDIVRPNLAGTQNILEVAAQQNVKKVIYVSSIAALNKDQSPMEETSWNQNPDNPYYRSKTESEKLALDLAGELGLYLIRVLPAAMIGPNCHGELTPTMGILAGILENKQPVDPVFSFNFVHVEDVAAGMMAAEKYGGNGERYILGNVSPTSTADIFAVARSVSEKVRPPVTLPRAALVFLAMAMELVSKVSGKKPDLTRELIKTYYKKPLMLNIEKARNALGFSPRDPEAAIRSAMEYLMAGR